MGYGRNSASKPIIVIGSSEGGGGVVPVKEKLIATTEGQQLFTLQNTYQVDSDRINVYVDNVPQFSPENFSETSSNSITLSEGVSVGTVVRVEIFQ